MSKIYEGCCGSEIQKLARLTYILEKNTFKLKGFTSSQAYTLLELLDEEGIPMKEISERMALDCSTMTRNISKLVDSGIVQKWTCEGDRRVTRISLTEKGETKAREIKEAFIGHFGEIVCRLPKEKFDIIFEGISILTETFEKERKINEKKQ